MSRIKGLKIFKYIDKDGSGNIDLEELSAAVKMDKLISQLVFGNVPSDINNEKTIQTKFEEMDTSRDGKVSPEKFKVCK